MELVLTLPAVFMFVLVAVQVAVIGRDQILVVNAARAGARMAAVSDSWADTKRAVEASGPLDPDRIHVSRLRDLHPGGIARVTVHYRAATDLPVVGRLVPDMTLSATMTMRVER